MRRSSQQRIVQDLLPKTAASSVMQIHQVSSAHSSSHSRSEEKLLVWYDVCRALVLREGGSFFAIYLSRSRLYRGRILRPNIHFSAFFKIYKIHIPLHRSIFKICRFFSKFSLKIMNFRDFCKFFVKFAQICIFSPKFSRIFIGIAGIGE